MGPIGPLGRTVSRADNAHYVKLEEPYVLLPLHIVRCRVSCLTDLVPSKIVSRSCLTEAGQVRYFVSVNLVPGVIEQIGSDEGQTPPAEHFG